MNSVFIHFYRRNEPFKQLFRRLLAPSVPFGPGRVDVRKLAKHREGRLMSMLIHAAFQRTYDKLIEIPRRS